MDTAKNTAAPNSVVRGFKNISTSFGSMFKRERKVKAQVSSLEMHDFSQAISSDNAPDNGLRTMVNEDLIVNWDIGGTNARLGLWKCDGNSNVEVYSEVYPTTQFTTFEDCLQAFLDEAEVRGSAVEAAALAVAVLNDFEAVGYGIPALGPDDMVALNDAPMVPKAPKVVMGPGTGLGAAQLFWDTGLQMALTAYVTARIGHCEIEEVACGRGLELIYEFLLSDPTIQRPAYSTKSSTRSERKLAPEITAEALEGEPLASQVAITHFRPGSLVGAVEVTLGSTGILGRYRSGGILPRLVDRVKEDGVLLESFCNRTARDSLLILHLLLLLLRSRHINEMGRFQYLLEGMPLYLVTNTKVGIIGSREFAMQLVRLSSKVKVA
eukprot:gene2657-2956_t